METKIKELLSKDMRDTPVIRTYFGEGSSDEAFNKLIELHSAYGAEGFRAFILGVNDSAFEGLTREKLKSAEFKESMPVHEGYAILCDEQSFKDETLLIVELHEPDYEGYPPEFRVIASETWGPQNNLSISNMDFNEFSESADEDGVFRGFPRVDPVVTEDVATAESLPSPMAVSLQLPSKSPLP